MFVRWREIDWRQPSVISLIVANLVPIFGVVFLHWEVFPLMFLFWSENVIIGVFNVLKLLLANPDLTANWLGKLFLVPFFCFHYGLFTLVHGIFVVELFGRGQGMHGFPSPAMFWEVMRENELGWAILGLTVSRGISFVTNYVWKGEYKRVRLDQLMTQPYGRIVVMHLAILFGGFLMMALHSPMMGLVLLVILKICLDLKSHIDERKKFAESISEAGDEVTNL